MSRSIAAPACVALALLAVLVPPAHAESDLGVCSQSREWGGEEDSTGTRDCVVLVQGTEYVCVGYHQEYRSMPREDHVKTTCQHRLV